MTRIPVVELDELCGIQQRVNEQAEGKRCHIRREGPAAVIASEDMDDNDAIRPGCLWLWQDKSVFVNIGKVGPSSISCAYRKLRYFCGREAPQAILKVLRKL